MTEKAGKCAIYRTSDLADCPKLSDQKKSQTSWFLFSSRIQSLYSLCSRIISLYLVTSVNTIGLL